jgi:NAD(P)-dependent dehydrogenase (short-subunit alcohol dehydrogenase family)
MGRATAERLAEQGARVAVPDDMAGELTRDAAFPRRMGRPDEYAALALAIVENQMLNGSAIRLDAGQRFAPK